MLLSPFVMKVKAASSYTVYTTIDENANYVYDITTNNSSNKVSSPGTGDLGLIYISLLLISSVGVVVFSKKVRI